LPLDADIYVEDFFAFENSPLQGGIWGQLITALTTSTVKQWSHNAFTTLQSSIRYAEREKFDNILVMAPQPNFM